MAPEVEAWRLDAGFGPERLRAPAYPPLARRLNRSGRVRVEVAVAQDGRVGRVSVAEEPAGWGFGAAVAEAYRAARFSPPTMGGRPVRVIWRKTVLFRP